MKSRVKLGNDGRAFAFILWGAHEHVWSDASRELAHSSDPIARHLSGYPLGHTKLPKKKIAPIPKAVEAGDLKRLVALIPWHLRAPSDPTPLPKAVAAVSGLDMLTDIDRAVDLAERVTLLKTGEASQAAPPPANPVAAYAAEYEGPKGKVEAAAEQFQLSIPEAAAAIRQPVHVPESRDELRNMLALYMEQSRRLERENRALRALVHGYMPTDDL